MDDDFYEFYRAQKEMIRQFDGKIKNELMLTFMADMKISLTMLDRENNEYLLRYQAEMEKKE